MTDTEINTAIAEACGWTDTPDAVNDLNAMHEAEKVMSEGELWSMAYALPHVSPLNFRATARQRAEAFLRTLGKWKEAAK